MARLVLVVQTVTREGVDIGSGQAVLNADGAECPNDGDTILKLQNTTGGAIVVTFVTPMTILTAPALAVADQAYSVPASVTRYIRVGSANVYNQADGNMDIDVASDGVTMTAINMGSAV